jgi:hypothetical protein
MSTWLDGQLGKLSLLGPTDNGTLSHGHGIGGVGFSGPWTVLP